MNKLPECDRCLMNARWPKADRRSSQYLVCAIYPEGYQGEACLDFARIPGLKQEPWSPVGASYYGGKLISQAGHLSRCDREWLVEHHPLFTGNCPECGAEYAETPVVHWDCEGCGWLDDSV